jgi:hypothetical protein
MFFETLPRLFLDRATRSGWSFGEIIDKMSKFIGLTVLAFAALVGCGSETVDVSAPTRTPPMADHEGCYNVGEDPHTFGCTPGCNYLEGTLAPFHGVTAGICVLACHANGRLVPSCSAREDAATDTNDAAADDGPSVDTTDVVMTEDTMPVDLPHVRCMNDLDCDDRDEMTTDRCNLVTGVCNHTRTVEPPFDPVMRQAVTNLCEQPTECSSGNAARLRFACGTYGVTTWNELGYLFDVSFEMPPSSHVVHIRPRLSAGDPRDSFRVRVIINSSMTAIIDRTLTVAEIERGFAIPLTMAGDILFSFRPAGDSLFTRTLQWDLPVGHVTDGEGHNLSTCLQSGQFMPIPQHGFLRLQTGTDGRLECAGRVLRTDTPSGIMVGWAREESSSTLYYIHFPPAPSRYVYSFATAQEAIDWINPPLSLQTLCAVAMVFPDGTFSSLMGVSRVEVGVRPGVYVDWRDTMGMRHEGITGYDFVIHETRWPVDAAYGCSLYSQLAPMRDPDHLCAIDVTSILSRYTVRSTPMASGFTAMAWRAVARIETYREMR